MNLTNPTKDNNKVVKGGRITNQTESETENIASKYTSKALIQISKIVNLFSKLYKEDDYDSDNDDNKGVLSYHLFE